MGRRATSATIATLALALAACSSGRSRRGGPVARGPVAPVSGAGLACAAPAPRPLPPDFSCHCPRRRDTYAGASLSLLPNVGLAVEAGRVFHEDNVLRWSYEARATYQFLDDKDFIDNGNPPFDDWRQLEVGVRLATDPYGCRHWTARAGLVWFQANGEPNIVNEEGDYFGVYGGFGFETDLSERVSMGPELSVLIAAQDLDSRIYFVPQLNWRIVWKF